MKILIIDIEKINKSLNTFDTNLKHVSQKLETKVKSMKSLSHGIIVFTIASLRWHILLHYLQSRKLMFKLRGKYSDKTHTYPRNRDY